LVYYWFQQRGRDITNEYLVKWYLFWDSLTRDRSDGALVRLTTPLKEAESASSADARLAAFAKAAVPRLDKYVPN
jgi:EpsI family protein